MSNKTWLDVAPGERLVLVVEGLRRGRRREAYYPGWEVGLARCTTCCHLKIVPPNGAATDYQCEDCAKLSARLSKS
jgi:hypothetical protein